MTPLIVLPTWLIDVIAGFGWLAAFCLLSLDFAGITPAQLRQWWLEGWRPWRP